MQAKIKEILLIILISTIVVLTVLFLIYNFLPLSTIDLLSVKTREPELGAAITTIASSDTLRDSRGTINTNFANLNQYKTETSTTSVDAITTLSNLVTVGTLTSGSLGSGFTTVTVARGGTGSTTLSANQILLGNGTGNVSVVNGLGASGQFLTSNGAGAAPSWTTSSVDQGIAYDWTATHTFGATSASGVGIGTSSPGVANQLAVEGDVLFTGTTTLNQLNIGTSTIRINGQIYQFPSIGGASSTILAKNADEGLFWTMPGLVTFAIPSYVGGNASTTSEMTLSDNTLHLKAAYLLSNPIEVANITIDVLSVSTAGTLDITIYSEDGQSQMIAVTTASISSAGLVTTAVSPAVFLHPGIYYITVNTNSTTNLNVRSHARCHNEGSAGSYMGENLNRLVTGEPDICGEDSITAGSPPSTIDTTTFQSSAGGPIMVRFDN